MSTSIPIICSGCGGNLSSMAFYEDSKPYHFGCRPSQQVVIGVATASQQEHADLLARITELRLELTRMTWVADRESDLAGLRHHRWYQEKCRAEAAEVALKGAKTSLTLSQDKNVRLRAAFNIIEAELTKLKDGLMHTGAKL